MAVQKTIHAWIEAGQQLGLSFKQRRPPTRLWDSLTLEGSLEGYELTISTKLTMEEGVGGGVFRRESSIRVSVLGLPPGLVVGHRHYKVEYPNWLDRYVFKADDQAIAVRWLSPVRRDAIQRLPHFYRIERGTMQVTWVGVLKTSEEIATSAKATVALAKILDPGR